MFLIFVVKFVNIVIKLVNHCSLLMIIFLFGGHVKKVILIAFYFNQVNEIASKRLRALAKYLPKFGWTPIVIVPDLGQVPNENADLNCRIVYTQYEDMFSHFSRMFKFSNSMKNGSVNDLEDFEQDKLKDSNSFSNPIASKAVSVAGELFAFPDGMKYWHEPAVRVASKIIEEEEIDAIISSSGPVTCNIIAKELKEKYGIKWIADLRDLWNLNPYISHTFIRNHFEKKLELETFESVDALTTTTDLAAKTLSALHPNKRIIPILSGYDEEEFRFLGEIMKNRKESSSSSKSSNKLKFIYAGSLYGGKRDPTDLFKAIRHLEDENKIDSSKISIEFYGDSTNLEEISSKYDLRDILKIGGKIPHAEVIERQLESDVLLIISWNNENEKMFIPGKIYEYFELKKPILSIGYKEGSLKDLIEETNVGYHVSDFESTKEAVLNIYDGFIEKGTVNFNSDINITDYSMRNMANKFADLLDDICK